MLYVVEFTDLINLLIDVCFDQHSAFVLKQLFFSHPHLNNFEQKINAYFENAFQHLTFCSFLIICYIFSTLVNRSYQQQKQMNLSTKH